MLKPNFNKQQIASMLQRKRESIFMAIQSRLQRIGEAFVTNARQNGTYQDHTGNLRSSIGYVVLKNGVQVDANFKAIRGAGKQIPGLVALVGPEQAQKIAEEIASKYTVGLVLICVAGMEYAAAVESKGFDVITSSSLIAKNDLEKALADIQRKVNSNPLN